MLDIFSVTDIDYNISNNLWPYFNPNCKMILKQNI